MTWKYQKVRVVHLASEKHEQYTNLRLEAGDYLRRLHPRRSRTLPFQIRQLVKYYAQWYTRALLEAWARGNILRWMHDIAWQYFPEEGKERGHLLYE